MSCRIVQVFEGADLRCGHDGLSVLAKKNGVDLQKLEDGELAIFINTKVDKMKVYAANDIFAYYRSPRGRIEMRAIQYIPQAFGGSRRVDYEKALEILLRKTLKNGEA